MSATDLRGNPCGSTEATAREHAERALAHLMVFDDTPFAALDAAIAADPGWALPHAMKAGFLLSLTEPGLLQDARAHLERASALLARAPERERAHVQALRHVVEGRWHGACRTWDQILIDHPRDALALQWAHLWDFYRGDAASLRQRPARALPDWDDADPLQPHVLALYAFGLEECNLYPQAEEAGRRALTREPRAPWAVHAVAHVMEMQGRFEEGAAWLRQHQPHWAEGNGFAAHLWWHAALFRIETLDLHGALRLMDTHLSGAALQLTLQRVDAAALMWRLHLLGEDLSAACAALLADWPAGDDNAGYYAFNDVHRVLAMLAAGDIGGAEAWVARCASRALDAADAARANHAMAREVGLPLLRGFLAYARGDWDAAADALYPARARAHHFGGSHAQRDLIDQTLLAAATRGRRRSLGRALLNERLLAKPMTPLTRHWMQAMRA